jgi:hypothetical protein
MDLKLITVLLRIQDFKRRQWNAVDYIGLNFITKLQKASL